MKITHIFAQNFCKFYGKNTLDTDFSMKTVLSGQNEVGKSTVKRIILDVLNCHDENDREITGIRPHDENGVEIDDVDIVRAVTFEIDGKEVATVTAPYTEAELAKRQKYRNRKQVIR